ncbi:hypothetical protein PTKIN_Ptkin06aG0181100 [Pterospermum kingtungense]
MVENGGLGRKSLAFAMVENYCEGNSNELCIGSERQALLKFKQDIIDGSKRLSSWFEGEDCCEWIGVICNNMTGHVKFNLHLGILRPDDDATDAERDAYYRSKLGGKINPSLLDLKYLSFLDLTINTDQSSPISVNYTCLAVLHISWNKFSSVPTWIYCLPTRVH